MVQWISFTSHSSMNLMIQSYLDQIPFQVIFFGKNSHIVTANFSIFLFLFLCFSTVFIFPTVSIPKEREKDTIELLQVMMWGLKIQLAIQREVSIIISSSYVWEKASLIGATYNVLSLIPKACIHSFIFIRFIFLNNSL